MEIGVDGIISDVPTTLAKVLRRQRRRLGRPPGLRRPAAVEERAQPRPQFGFLPWLAFFLALSLRFTVRFDIRTILVRPGRGLFPARPAPPPARPVVALAEPLASDAYAVRMAAARRRRGVRTRDDRLVRRNGPRGCTGRDGCEGGLHLAGARAVHTAGMKFPLDVAFLSEDLIVVRMVRMPPWRVALPRPGARSVLQTEAGALERWGVRVADQLEIREVQ